MKLSLSAHQFQLVLRKSDGFVANNLKFRFLPSNENLIGFTINKKLGPATQRNFFKRRCRSLFTETFKNSPDIYLVVSPQKSLHKINNIGGSFQLLQQHIGA